MLRRFETLSVVEIRNHEQKLSFTTRWHFTGQNTDLTFLDTAFKIITEI